MNEKLPVLKQAAPQMTGEDACPTCYRTARVSKRRAVEIPFATSRAEETRVGTNADVARKECVLHLSAMQSTP